MTGGREPWRLLLEHARALDGRLESPHAFAAAAVTGARAIVACDLAAYHEYDPAAGRGTAHDDPPGTITPDLLSAFIRHADQHPVLRRHLGGHTGTLCLADFLNARALRALELYDAYYRPLGISQQMCIPLPRPIAGPGIAGIALYRSKGGFSEDERLRADHWREHLVGAIEREYLRRQHDRLRRAIDDCGLGVVILDAANRPMLVTPVAERQLATYVGRSDDERLPTSLDRWLAARQTAAHAPIAFEHCGRSLHIRFVGAEDPGAPDLLLLEEHAPIDWATVREAFGLTAREAQLLELVADGRANAEIAAELHISPATVKQHLAHIYAKLDVRSRTAAVARVRQPAPATAESPAGAAAHDRASRLTPRPGPAASPRPTAPNARGRASAR